MSTDAVMAFWRAVSRLRLDRALGLDRCGLLRRTAWFSLER
jgi:hypothetical protein